MIRAVIFDKDGVIVDSEPLHAKANQLVLRHFGREVPTEYFHQFIGSSLPPMIEQINLDLGLSVSADDWYEVDARITRDLIKREGYPAVPHVVNAIRNLSREGYLLAVASNSSLDEIAFTLDYLGLASYFHQLASGLDVPKPKPAPDIFLKAAEALRIPPHECLVFEDSYLGCLAACEAGMVCVGYRNANSGNQDLSPALLCIESFETVDAQFMSAFP